MSQQGVATPDVDLPSIPLRQIAPWAFFFGLLALLTLFFISTDQGAVSLFAGTAVHEWVHDGRHLLAYPCH
ncbi:MAG: CbtB domain-containing protein [Nocardioidaceae bacterium]